MKIIDKILNRKKSNNIHVEQLEFYLPGSHLTSIEVSFLEDLRRLRSRLISEGADAGYKGKPGRLLRA